MESNIPLEQQKITNEPKPKKLLNLSLRKKKDKFSGRNGEKVDPTSTASLVASTVVIVYFMAELKNHVKLQIANISKTENSELEIHIPSCQQQENGVDCRIFAVANAFYILSAIEVSSIRIDENNMRTHFLQCLEQGHFEPFPEKETDGNPPALFWSSFY